MTEEEWLEFLTFLHIYKSMPTRRYYDCDVLFGTLKEDIYTEQTIAALLPYVDVMVVKGIIVDDAPGQLLMDEKGRYHRWHANPSHDFIISLNDLAARHLHNI